MEENISAPETQKSKLDSSRLFQQIFLCCSITGTLLLGFALGITLHFSISTFQTQLDDMLKTTALSLADSAMVREAYHRDTAPMSDTLFRYAGGYSGQYGRADAVRLQFDSAVSRQPCIDWRGVCGRRPKEMHWRGKATFRMPLVHWDCSTAF